jgi:hypothetical protein
MNGQRRKPSSTSSTGATASRSTRAQRRRTPSARYFSRESKTGSSRIGERTEYSAIRRMAGQWEPGRASASRRHRAAHWLSCLFPLARTRDGITTGSKTRQKSRSFAAVSASGMLRRARHSLRCWPFINPSAPRYARRVVGVLSLDVMPAYAAMPAGKRFTAVEMLRLRCNGFTAVMATAQHR